MFAEQSSPIINPWKPDGSNVGTRYANKLRPGGATGSKRTENCCDDSWTGSPANQG